MIDDGRVAAFDTPDALAMSTDGAQHLAFTPSLTISDADIDLIRALTGVASLSVTADRIVASGHDIATPVLMFLAERGITPLRLRLESLPSSRGPWCCAGRWIPRSIFFETLATVADWTPSGAASRAMLDSMYGDWPAVQSVSYSCSTPPSAVVATRTFRWE